MKFLAVIGILILGTGLTFIAYTALTSGKQGLRALLRRRERVYGKWTLEEESDGEQVVVYAVEPGTDRKLLVGAAAFAAADFDMQLETIRSEGRMKLITLNSNRAALNR